jgi:hypothetical protein
MFISTDGIFLKIQYFPSQFFLINFFSKNNIISVENAKEVGYTLVLMRMPFVNEGIT